MTRFPRKVVRETAVTTLIATDKSKGLSGVEILNATIVASRYTGSHKRQIQNGQLSGDTRWMIAVHAFGHNNDVVGIAEAVRLRLTSQTGRLSSPVIRLTYEI
ncbi:hypothetical protein [Hoeflea poritis]|uniref:Uncharacterized protein n=1 Tax=Hoeflea poritis TaxID=2993659 RepID=A0ABT4VK25_9HYPH|nr:hypothetical protein [Hoeflea poritis]MDA4845054.1 hypothetical protein [Hoeflea poritis]